MNEPLPMLISRPLQRLLLETLAGYFPYTRSEEQLRFPQYSESELMANLYYLKQHQLVSFTCDRLGEFDKGRLRIRSQIEITHKGIDFMLADGGLSAILNLQTVRLHEDTLRPMLEALVRANNGLDEPEKNMLLEKLAEAPAELLKNTAQSGLQLLLQSLTNAIG